MLHYELPKQCYFAKTKDRTAFLSHSWVVYKFACPDSKSRYVRKTDSMLHERTKEHAHSSGNKNKQSAIYEHLLSSMHIIRLQAYSELKLLLVGETIVTY